MNVAIRSVLSLRFVTHVGFRNGLWRRYVADCSHLLYAAKPLFLFVGTYGIEMRSLVAKDIMYVSKFESDCRPGAIAAALALYMPKYLETAADLFETFNVPAMHVAKLCYIPLDYERNVPTRCFVQEGTPQVHGS